MRTLLAIKKKAISLGIKFLSNPSMAITNFRPDIDGLRAAAMLAVVVYYLSAAFMPGGYIDVDVFFFAISGYLITRIISREMEECTFALTRFYELQAQSSRTGLAMTFVARYFLLLANNYVSKQRVGPRKGNE